MDSNEFNPEAPGKLVPTIQDELAFVPDPIPEDLILPGGTIKLIAAAERSVGRLSGTVRGEINPFLVGSPLLQREALVSSRMEGTVTTPEQLVTFNVLFDEQKNKRAEAREVYNYIMAMRRGIELLKEIPVSLRLIRETHKTLLDEVRGGKERPGQFREAQNWIRGKIDDSIRNARFVPPPSAHMQEALNDLEKYINQDQDKSDVPLLVQLALMHYQFETIHPFRDGNGRIGRLLISLLMCSHERLDTPLLHMSAAFERKRDQYRDLLLRVSQKGDFLMWIDFFLEAVKESAEEAVRLVDRLLKLRRNYQKKFQKKKSSALLMTLIDDLFQRPSTTVKEAEKLLRVSQPTAGNYIKTLVNEGILVETTGQKRNRIFMAEEIMRISFYDDSEYSGKAV